jgi:hypothetical protein
LDLSLLIVQTMRASPVENVTPAEPLRRRTDGL